jgi:hypothetical protein
MTNSTAQVGNTSPELLTYPVLYHFVYIHPSAIRHQLGTREADRPIVPWLTGLPGN